jgi:hypothetical protein
MNRVQAIAAVQSSLEKGSSMPCTWPDDREAYIASESKKLLECVIDPSPAKIVAESFNYGLKDKLDHVEVFAVARREDNWLLYVPESGEFSLAYGAAPDSLTILGFGSPDALAEWLG